MSIHDRPATESWRDRVPDTVETKARSVTPLNADVLLQMVQQNDEKHEDGHQRLRQDIRALENETHALENEAARILHKLVELDSKVTRLETRQPDLSQVLVPGKMLVAAVLFSASIVGAMWAITYGLRSDVRDLITQQEAHTRLEDERSNTLKESISDAKKMSEMQRVQLESLTKTVLTQQRRER